MVVATICSVILLLVASSVVLDFCSAHNDKVIAHRIDVRVKRATELRELAFRRAPEADDPPDSGEG